MKTQRIGKRSFFFTSILAPRVSGLDRAAARQGFTLLEVMIAMAILAIVLVTVFHSQSQSIAMANESRAMTTLAPASRRS